MQVEEVTNDRTPYLWMYCHRRRTLPKVSMTLVGVAPAHSVLQVSSSKVKSRHSYAWKIVCMLLLWRCSCQVFYSIRVSDPSAACHSTIGTEWHWLMLFQSCSL